MENKYIVVACVLSAVAGATITRIYATREVIKTVVQTQEIVKDKIITVTKEVDKPDGSKEINITRTDDVVSNKDTTVSQTDTKTADAHSWHGSFGMDASRKIYASVERRVLGPVYIGISANTVSGGNVAAIVGMDF